MKNKSSYQKLKEQNKQLTNEINTLVNNPYSFQTAEIRLKYEVLHSIQKVNSMTEKGIGNGIVDMMERKPKPSDVLIDDNPSISDILDAKNLPTINEEDLSIAIIGNKYQIYCPSCGHKVTNLQSQGYPVIHCTSCKHNYRIEIQIPIDNK